jgi:hypothetical protein
MHLNLGDELVKLAEVELLFKPLSSIMSVLRSTPDASRDEFGMGCDLQFINFSWRPSGDLWEDKPSDNNGDEARTCEATIQIDISIFSTISFVREEKVRLQETCLDTPFGNSPIDH